MSGVRHLLPRLRTYLVDWKFSFIPAENVEYEPGIDRTEAELPEANVVSSELKHTWSGRRHIVALDIDYPAYLVPSSSMDHYHLYLDVPGGIAHEDYMELLALLGRLKIIETGYAEVSVKRGHSDLRLPWVTKEGQKIHKSGEPGVNLADADGNPAKMPDPWDGLAIPPLPTPENNLPF
jgi:hypothetical protein